MTERIIFCDETDPETFSIRIDITEEVFIRIFGAGENGEMTRFDEVGDWLAENRTKLEYMEVYRYLDKDQISVKIKPEFKLRVKVGWALFFPTSDDAFAFKMRWL